MSWTFLSCVLIVLAWLGLSFLWGRSFLTMIHAERDIASSIVFGYFSLQLLYQVFYLPFFLTRGSYRVVSYCWLVTVALCSALLLYYLRRHPSERRDRADWRAKVGLCAAAVLVLGLACFVALRAPLYGSDTLGYISEMNRCLNTDTLWINSGSVYFHSGMASMLQLFTVSALLTGIRPYYISLFTVRILGIVLSSLVVYHTGVILFRKACTKVCWPAITLAVLVPYLLMLWGSMYTAEFFYWRINEAKGYCQFVLLPMGFSIFLEKRSTC